MGTQYSRVVVTGGAGFIGSHLVDRLMSRQLHVKVLDNFSNGSRKNIERWLKNQRFNLIEGDLKNPKDAKKAVENVQLVFHLAANPEVRVGESEPSVHFRENLVATFNLLEAMRASTHAKNLVFTSTSTIYGEATRLPTPEDYGPTMPISTYGASKLGCEALASGYAHVFRLRTLILRLANVVGPRASHGVVVDFIKKLRSNPAKLEILGDGTQKKSYLHVSDCANAIVYLTHHFLQGKKKFDLYNVGSVDQIGVTRIAELVAREMRTRDTEFCYIAANNEGRGWLGDVKFMHLSTDKSSQVGWRPRYNSQQAIKAAAKSILQEQQHETSGDS